MLVLVVESATDTAAVALADETGVLGSVVAAGARRHTETIAPAIESVCRRVGVALSDVDLLGVDVGPGLFTGLRVGVGTVKALSFALGLPVVTATSLEVLAHAAAGSAPPDGSLVVPVVDARRSEVFSARFSTSGDGLVEVAVAALWAPADLAADLTAHPAADLAAHPAAPSGFLLAGDGALRYRDLFAAVPGAVMAGPGDGAPPVAALAALVVARGSAGDTEAGAEVMPLYLRTADARINWGQRIPARAASPAPAGG